MMRNGEAAKTTMLELVTRLSYAGMDVEKVAARLIRKHKVILTGTYRGVAWK